MEALKTVNCYCPECDTNTDQSVLDDPVILQLMCWNVLGERRMAQIGVEMMQCSVCQGRMPNSSQMADAIHECHNKVISDSLQIELNRLNWHWRERIADFLVMVLAILALSSMLVIGCATLETSGSILMKVIILQLFLVVMVALWITWYIFDVKSVQKSVMRMYANEVK